MLTSKCRDLHRTSRKTYFHRESIFMHKVHDHSLMQTIRYVQTANTAARCKTDVNKCIMTNYWTMGNLQMTGTGSSLTTTALWSTITDSDTNSLRLCYRSFTEIFCPWHSMKLQKKTINVIWYKATRVLCIMLDIITNFIVLFMPFTMITWKVVN